MAYKAHRRWIINLPENTQVKLLKNICEYFARYLNGDVNSLHDILEKRGTRYRLLKEKTTNRNKDWIEIKKAIKYRFFSNGVGEDNEWNDEEKEKRVSRLKELSSEICFSFVVEEQDVYLLRDICETFARFTAGQLGSIHDILDYRYVGNGIPNKIKSKWDEEWRPIEDKMRERYFPELTRNSSYGISSKEISSDSHRAWDFYQVFRNPIHLKSVEEEVWHNPCTHCHKPMQTSNCALPIIKEYQIVQNVK